MIKKSLVRYDFEELITTLKAMETLNVDYNVTRIYGENKEFYQPIVRYTITPMEDREDVN